MNISGANKVILYNVDTEENLTFRKISPESKYLKQTISEEDLDGNLIYSEDKFNLTLILFDEVAASELQESIAAGNKFRVEVIGLGEYIRWNKPSKVVFDDEFKFQVRQKNRVTIRFQSKGSDLDISRIIIPDPLLTAFSTAFSNSFY